jgi:hypothetical protein
MIEKERQEIKKHYLKVKEDPFLTVDHSTGAVLDNPSGKKLSLTKRDK